MSTEHRVCEHCGRGFVPSAVTGRPRRYCATPCAERASKRRRALAALGLSEEHAAVLALVELGHPVSAIATRTWMSMSAARRRYTQAAQALGASDPAGLVAAAHRAKVLPHPRLSIQDRAVGRPA